MKNRPRLLLCTDLDRTLLPNGDAPETPGVRTLFTAFAARPEVSLVYVTGRHPELVDEALARYALPEPDFLISDVGSQIYVRQHEHLRPCGDWQREIAADWGNVSHADLVALFADLAALRLQETARQSPFKLSYTCPSDTDVEELNTVMRRRLAGKDVRANLIWSDDDLTGERLLDVLPQAAGKRRAIGFLRRKLGYGNDEVLFAGDSGNDFDVLTSPVPSVLVANASREVRTAACQAAAEAGHTRALYCATGRVIDGLNGNYAAGILEGVVFYHPEYLDFIRSRI